MLVIISCIKRINLLVWFFFIFYLTSFRPTKVKSQDKTYPEIGKPCPEFTVRNVYYYKDKQIAISSLNDKYTILDFWATSCGVCIESFPKMSEMQKRFDGKLNIILIGLEEKQRDIRKFYEKFRFRHNLNLISAYDSIAYKRFVFFTVPHVVWINKQGIIKAITSSGDVTPKNIESFIAGRDFRFNDNSHQAYVKPKIDLTKPLLIHGNGGTDTSYIFRSVLSKWKPELGAGQVQGIDFYLSTRSDQYQITGANPIILYRIAYWGDYSGSKEKDIHPGISFNVKDSVAFTNAAYNYSIQLPKGLGSKKRIMEAMQQDLRSAFGYDAQIVKKKMSVLKLVIVDKSKTKKLVPASTDVNFRWDVESKTNFFNNHNLSEILPGVTYHLPFKFKSLWYDETGILDKVSINIDAYPDDYEGIRREFRKCGLDLIVSEREFRMLEVYEPEKN